MLRGVGQEPRQAVSGMLLCVSVQVHGVLTSGQCSQQQLLGKRAPSSEAGCSELHLLTQQHWHTVKGNAGLKEAAFRSPTACTTAVGC